VHDNGGTDRSGLEHDLEQVQDIFARNFPDLASQYGTSDTTVEDINVGYYSAG